LQLVHKQVGPVANFKQVAIVSRLPKTRSGKVLRGTRRQIADAQPSQTPATVDDPLALDEIKAALRGLGYARESKSQIGD
jgi:propionyl-CoA synthetase